MPEGWRSRQDARGAAGVMAPVAMMREVGPRARGPMRPPTSRCIFGIEDREEATAAFAEALLRLAARAIEREVQLMRPGHPSLSFDETWLLCLISAAREGDEASLREGLASRVPKPMRGAVAMLVEGLAERIGPSRRATGRAQPGERGPVPVARAHWRLH